MTSKAIRILKTYELIPTHPRKISTRRLVDVLNGKGINTSMRMVQRDLNEISGWFPVVGDEHCPQGWSVLDGCGVAV